MKKFRVLIVDDEDRTLNFVKTKLKASGYEALTAHDGIEALERVNAQQPDLIVLDVLMPKMNGFDVLKELRSFSSIPVIVLSARGSDTDKIKGLELGADDYLPKPFNPNELVARIEAVRRRLEPEEDRKNLEPLSIGGMDVDFKRRAVFVEGHEVYLTRIEWLLISQLARNSGRILTYEELLNRVWGPEYVDDIQLLRTWISRLRNKLEKNPESPELIRTMPKAGYIIEPPPELKSQESTP